MKKRKLCNRQVPSAERQEKAKPNAERRAGQDTAAGVHILDGFYRVCDAGRLHVFHRSPNGDCASAKPSPTISKGVRARRGMITRQKTEGSKPHAPIHLTPNVLAPGEPDFTSHLGGILPGSRDGLGTDARPGRDRESQGRQTAQPNDAGREDRHDPRRSGTGCN